MRALLVLFVAVASAGCMTLNPASRVRANGDPLVVDDEGRLLLGRTPIDEQDWYAIAGDRTAVAQIRARRGDLMATQVLGQAAGAAGIGGALLGGGALAGGIVWTVSDGPVGLVLLLPGALLFTGSVVAIPVGYAMAAEAADEMFTYVVPEDRAREAARRYNEGGRRRRR